MASSFSVSGWLASHPARDLSSVHVSQPELSGSCWTALGATAASGSGGGGDAARVRFDASGLLPFQPPSLPASLETGVSSYVAKSGEEDVGVERVVRAAAAGGAAFAGAVVSFRNNLIKVYGVPFDAKAAWTVDACLLPVGGGNGAAGDGGTLFLDIVKREEAWSGGPGQEKFVRWGYT